MKKLIIATSISLCSLVHTVEEATQAGLRDLQGMSREGADVVTRGADEAEARALQEGSKKQRTVNPDALAAPFRDVAKFGSDINNAVEQRIQAVRGLFEQVYASPIFNNWRTRLVDAEMLRYRASLYGDAAKALQQANEPALKQIGAQIEKDVNPNQVLREARAQQMTARSQMLFSLAPTMNAAQLLALGDMEYDALTQVQGRIAQEADSIIARNWNSIAVDIAQQAGPERANQIMNQIRPHIERLQGLRAQEELVVARMGLAEDYGNALKAKPDASAVMQSSKVGRDIQNPTALVKTLQMVQIESASESRQIVQIILVVILGVGITLAALSAIALIPVGILVINPAHKTPPQKNTYRGNTAAHIRGGI